MSIIWIIIALVVIVVLYAISVYNRLVRLRNQGEEAEAAIDAHLKQRYDLVPNLVETVKGYAQHEQKTLTAVIEARNMAVNATGLEARDAADKTFASTLKTLFAVAEAYPDLKANKGFLDLQTQLQKIEAELLNARKYYNAIIKQFNTVIEIFPSSVIAGMGHFTKKPYLTIEAEARERVQVKF
ncbi:LemA family protein [Parasphaerochaeta coccoides]|uniref:LemA family protein n=1 Tax=Parasphaerochaeta coccoides (strain ATCC BAA-1237 / DSM 17374 / SPN1) TaxID=760011 RepID=F4GKN1_PARC1|nr:LemA family protein [Parasphaerochaeta coccoides]AEC01440.1 LemA family protein [Parasphaerochaeta coccoides DSM 17374]